VLVGACRKWLHYHTTKYLVAKKNILLTNVKIEGSVRWDNSTSASRSVSVPTIDSWTDWNNWPTLQYALLRPMHLLLCISNRALGVCVGVGMVGEYSITRFVVVTLQLTLEGTLT
jgi:hypothetical protein